LEGGLNYLEMVFPSYGRIDMKFMSNLPLFQQTTTRKKSFEESFLGKEV